jgi:hypothetical protein
MRLRVHEAAFGRFKSVSHLGRVGPYLTDNASVAPPEKGSRKAPITIPSAPPTAATIHDVATWLHASGTRINH